MENEELSREELHSLTRLNVWPRLDMVPDAHIEKFQRLGLVKPILGGQGWKPNDEALRLLRGSRSR